MVSITTHSSITNQFSQNRQKHLLDSEIKMIPTKSTIELSVGESSRARKQLIVQKVRILNPIKKTDQACVENNFNHSKVNNNNQGWDVMNYHRSVNHRLKLLIDTTFRSFSSAQTTPTRSQRPRSLSTRRSKKSPSPMTHPSKLQSSIPVSN